MAAIGRFEQPILAFAMTAAVGGAGTPLPGFYGRVKIPLTKSPHFPVSGAGFSGCFASAEANLIGSMPMTHASNATIPELSPSPLLAPNEIVPLLIGSTVGEIERELVLQTLARCHGNRTRAARLLGMSVRTLRNKIRIYSADGIDVPAPSD
jgi:Bacterial regulatory protein, Fis family